MDWKAMLIWFSCPSQLGKIETMMTQLLECATRVPRETNTSRASNFVLKLDFNCCMHLVLCLHGRNKQVRETIQRGTLRLRFTSCGLAGALPLRNDPFSSIVIGVGTSPINFNPRKNCYFKFSILASLDLRPCVCVCEGPSLEKQIWIHSAACMASSVQPVGAAKGCNAKWQKSLLIRVNIFEILCCWC